MPVQPKNVRPSDSSLLKYASMGTQMLVIMALFTFGGYALDKWLELQFPIFTVLLSLFGIAAALYLSIKDFLRMNSKKKE